MRLSSFTRIGLDTYVLLPHTIASRSIYKLNRYKMEKIILPKFNFQCVIEAVFYKYITAVIIQGCMLEGGIQAFNIHLACVCIRERGYPFIKPCSTVTMYLYSISTKQNPCGKEGRNPPITIYIMC